MVHTVARSRDSRRPGLMVDTGPEIALYFPRTTAMEELKPVVESTLALQGVDPTTLLAVHSLEALSEKPS